MRKLSLVLLAVILGSCGSTPLVKVDMASKVPYISVGNKYIYYHTVSTGVVRCDTVEVTGVEGDCVRYCHKKETYMTSKTRFRGSTDPIKKK